MSTNTTNKATKFTEDEIKSLTDVRGKFTEISYKLGQIEIQKMALKEERERYLQFFKETQEEEKKSAKELIAKYGKGTIDIDSGEFIPEA